MQLDRYIFTGFSHLVCTGLVFKILLFILPWNISSWFLCVGELLLISIVAKITFGFTKEYFLNEEIAGFGKKVVLITGCDHGFGNELAIRMHSKGFHVVACCLNDESKGAEDLKKQFPNRMKVLKMDVTSDKDVENAEETVKNYLKEHKLELWTVVNNAGIYKGLTVEFTKLDVFEDVMKVNTFGVVRVTKKFLPLIRKSKGRVVNVASLSARVPLGHMAPYSMSKFAAAAFTECLRQEMLAWGVKVISIEPEFFKTPMADENNLKKSIEDTFNSIDENIKKEYKNDYLEHLKSHLMLGPSINSEKIYKVIDALEKATCLMYPDAVYRPSRNAVMSTISWSWINMPTMIQDVVHFLYQRKNLSQPSVEYPDHER